MNVLLVKLNATGDVVRTTTLLRRLTGAITWLTAPANAELLDRLPIEGFRCVSWEDREQSCDRRYDLVVNLEDTVDCAAFVSKVDSARIFGAHLDDNESVSYTEDSRRWFDMSLVSVFGRKRADQLKLDNRRSYQEIIFEGLGLRFEGEPYLVVGPAPSSLSGDVAIAPVAGPVWPMKGWAYYDQLKQELEAAGLTVNVLPRRSTLLQHMGDISNHRCLVGGDSLPMHLAMGTRVPCVTLFNCTSPWEIYDYGLQTKIVSPLLDRFFYQRGHDIAATTAIRLGDVYDAVIGRLNDSAQKPLTSESS